MAQPGFPAAFRNIVRSKHRNGARYGLPSPGRREERVFSVTISTSPRRAVFDHIDFGHRCVALLESQALFCGAPIYAYCLLPEEAQFLIGVSPRAPLPRFVERWKSRCSREWWRLERQEPFWQHGFDETGPHAATEVPSAAARILENPVRVGLVDDPGSYPLAGSFVWKV